MRQLYIQILLIFLCTTLHAQTQNASFDIIGKWWTFHIPEKEYIEFDISKNNIGIFSHFGYRGLIEYKLVNDKLLYISENTEYDIIKITANKFIIYDDIYSDTLSRLPDSIATYYSLDYQNDTIFNAFYEKFGKRARECWKKYRYTTDYESVDSIDENEIIIEEIIINRKNN